MKIKEKLKKIIAENDCCEGNSLKTYVCEYLIEKDEDYDNIKGVFKDLQRSGCVSGMVASLTSWVETHNFFDKYYYEIMEIIEDWEENNDRKFRYENDLKNDYAWFGFERMAEKIADELELEI